MDMDIDIDKFCYGHITGESCDEYINHLIYNHLIKNGFIIKAPKTVVTNEKVSY